MKAIFPLIAVIALTSTILGCLQLTGSANDQLDSLVGEVSILTTVHLNRAARNQYDFTPYVLSESIVKGGTEGGIPQPSPLEYMETWPVGKKVRLPQSKDSRREDMPGSIAR
ncbi:MAG TPA: hypothetical protein VG734_18310 [Lacunisphaera sp.]|nr:hypothetical protein [Lacunisphaera sp.]